MSEQASSSWTDDAKIIAIYAVAVIVLVIGGAATTNQPAGDVHWWPLAAIGGGALAIYAGFKQLRKQQLIENTPTSKVRSLAVGDVEIKGTAQPKETAFLSPLTHTEACVYKLQVEEEHRNRRGSNWHTVLTMRNGAPFYLEDATGRVLVDPTEAALEVERQRRVHVDSGDLPPSQLTEWAVIEGHMTREEADKAAEESGFLEDLGDLFTGSETEVQEHFVEKNTRDRRYTEWVLGAGEEAYIFGGAYPAEGHKGSAVNPENLVIGPHEGTGRFIVSDKSETELVEDARTTIAVMFAIGLAAIPLGIVAGLRMLGMI